MKNLNITKGEARINRHSKTSVETTTGRSIASTSTYSTNTDAGKHIVENEANAILFADAFNTANKTGLLPSELAEQNEKLKSIAWEYHCQQHANGVSIISKERFTSDLMDVINTEPTTLTRSEAEKAMNKGCNVAHESWGNGVIGWKENGVYQQSNKERQKALTALEFLFICGEGKYQTGWRIVNPNNQ